MRNLIVITRPIEDAEDYAGELQAAGFKTFVEPMLSIEALDFEVPDLKDYDGLILTSANALRIYRENVGAVDLEISVYCVGKHTAAYAHSCGFKNVFSVDGTGADLLQFLLDDPQSKARRFLHLCGRHVAFPIAEKLKIADVSCTALPVYHTEKRSHFSDEFVSLLKSERIQAVTFFSIRTAQAFVDCVSKSESESGFSSIKSLSISKPVLECVRILPWVEAYASESPDRIGIMQLLKSKILI